MDAGKLKTIAVTIGIGDGSRVLVGRDVDTDEGLSLLVFNGAVDHLLGVTQRCECASCKQH